MANPTTNFGWVMPTATDLVTDLPADFNVFGQAVDTSMADLKGGTTGQILSKATSTDMDFTWITNDVGDITAVTAGTGISGGGTSGAVTVTNSMQTTITTAGDVLYGTGSAAVARLGIGTVGQVLTVNSGATAPEWATAPSGGMTLISTTSLTGATVTLSSFTGYTDLQLVVVGAYGTNQNTFRGRFNADTGSNYFLGTMTAGAVSTITSYIMGDGTSSSATGVDQRNVFVMNVQRYAQTVAKAFQTYGTNIFWSNTAQNYINVSNNVYTGTSAITTIELFMASGNFSGGTAYLYGVK
jgi:hypothetical protein